MQLTYSVLFTFTFSCEAFTLITNEHRHSYRIHRVGHQLPPTEFARWEDYVSTIPSGKISNTKLYSSSEVTPGVDDEGCSLPSPSGINVLPKPLQAMAFLGIASALYGSTVGAISVLEAIKSYIPGSIEFLLGGIGVNGILFFLAGITHFTLCDEYCNITPAQGSWGFWYIPGSKKFHVLWTGVAEMVFGFLLALGEASRVFGFVLPSELAHVSSDAALALLALTILVTPANVYMLTHGAKLPKSGPEVPISGHVIRLALQVVLFATFYEKALPTISSLGL